MKAVKYILAALFIIGGLGFSFQNSILSGIISIILGVILIPIISDKLRKSMNLWKQKGVRYVSYVLLFILSGAFSNITGETSTSAFKKSPKSSSYKSYNDKVISIIENLDEEGKESRHNTVNELQATETYKILVDSNKVSADYLPLITAINNGLRATSIKDNEKYGTVAFEQPLTKRIEDASNGKDKFDFVINSTILSASSKGGFPKELVEVFERYRKKFGLYGVPSKVYSSSGGNEKSIEYSYNMSSIFYLINPNNKTLDAIYEANKKGVSNWFSYNKNQKYVYEHLATKQGYLNYAREVNPNSPYILKVDYEVTANQLYRAYNTNEISADDKYKGKKLAVTGRISDISEVLGSISVDLKTGDSVGWTKVSCTMKNRDVVSKLRKGQEITITGTCEGLTLNISIDLDDCEIWE